MDFPSSPTTCKTLSDKFNEVGVRLAEGESDPLGPPDEEEDASVYTAIVSPPTGKVTLRKGERFFYFKKQIDVISLINWVYISNISEWL